MGGGTFKMCFQLCNTINSNSPQNTCVFSVFEAPDTYANLWIALHQFKEQIPKLEEKRWRYIILKKTSKPYIALLYTICRGKKVRVFLCGDYQFLCHMFGLSGASGMHIIIMEISVYIEWFRSPLLLVVSHKVRPTESTTSNPWSSSAQNNTIHHVRPSTVPSCWRKPEVCKGLSQLHLQSFFSSI